MNRFILLLFFLIAPDALFARLPDLIPYRKGDLWGYVDSTKKIIIEPQWKAAYPFCGATAAVGNGKRFALIDRSGKIVAPFKYQQMITDAVNGKRIVYSANGKKAGVIDETGKLVIPMEYDYLQWCGDKYLSAGRRKKEGVIDTSGKVIIPFIYNMDGYTYTWSDSTTTFFSVKTKEGCGVINDSGRVIIPFEYKWMHLEYGTVIMYRDGQDRDFYTKHGKLIGTQRAGETDPGMVYEAWATPKDSFISGGENRWGWVSPDGHWLNTYFYRYTDEFHYGRARIQTDDRHYGFVNEKFEIVIETKYARVFSFDHGGIALVFEHKATKKEITYLNVLGYIDIHGTEYWE